MSFLAILNIFLQPYLAKVGSMLRLIYNIYTGMAETKDEPCRILVFENYVTPYIIMTSRYIYL